MGRFACCADVQAYLILLRFAFRKIEEAGGGGGGKYVNKEVLRGLVLYTYGTQ